MTPAELANLASARRLAASRIGWTGPTSAIPYAQREAYATALASIILAYPSRFSAQTVNTARLELADAAVSPLGDYTTGAAVADFFGELGDQAADLGESVASVGEGVKTTLDLARFVIPAAALFLAVVYVRSFARSAH